MMCSVFVYSIAGNLIKLKSPLLFASLATSTTPDITMADGNIIYIDSLPGADGSISNQLHTEDIAVHRQRTIDLF